MHHAIGHDTHPPVSDLPRYRCRRSLEKMPRWVRVRSMTWRSRCWWWRATMLPIVEFLFARMVEDEQGAEDYVRLAELAHGAAI